MTEKRYRCIFCTTDIHPDDEDACELLRGGSKVLAHTWHTGVEDELKLQKSSQQSNDGAV